MLSPNQKHVLNKVKLKMLGYLVAEPQLSCCMHICSSKTYKLLLYRQNDHTRRGCNVPQTSLCIFALWLISTMTNSGICIFIAFCSIQSKDRHTCNWIFSEVCNKWTFPLLDLGAGTVGPQCCTHRGELFDIWKVSCGFSLHMACGTSKTTWSRVSVSKQGSFQSCCSNEFYHDFKICNCIGQIIAMIITVMCS